MVKKQEKTSVDFESALEKLEKIVEAMESEELSLDDSLKKYQEGIELIRLCSEKLQAAEKKIEVVVKEQEGKLYKAPFDESDE